MKLATWNVNSLAVRLPQVLDWLASAAPDVLVLQETKLTDDKFPQADFTAAGWQVQWFGQKTYNGVALISREPAVDLVRNIPGLDDAQARVIAGTVAGVRCIGAYFPNGQAPDSDKFVYKMRWLDALREWVRGELAAHPQLVLMGDFNIAPEDRDVYDPVAVGRADPLHARGTRAFPGPGGPGPGGRLPAVRATAQELELVGLPQPGLPQEPGPAHRPHPGQRGTAGPGAGLQHRQAAAQERAAQRPRTGAADAGPTPP